MATIVVTYEEDMRPESVKDYGIKWLLQDGETVIESTWEALNDGDGALSIGDGVTPVVTSAGTITPRQPEVVTEAPYEVSRAWFYNAVAGVNYRAHNVVRTSLRVYEAFILLRCRTTVES